MKMREWLCLVTEWSHTASQRSYLHGKTCYFGEEALRACDRSCSALRDVWELSLPVVWALIAAQVPPGLLIPCWMQDLLIPVQEVTATYFWSADRAFPLLHKENIFKYLFYLFSLLLFFCAECSCSLVLYFFFKHNGLLRERFPSTERLCCGSLWWCPQSVLLECSIWWCGFCIGGLQFAHIQKLSCLPGSLQLAAPATCPQINGRVFLLMAQPE